MRFQPIDKHSCVIAGHKTSISIEACYWTGLKAIAIRRDMLISELLTEIAAMQPDNLSSAIRQFILFDLQARATTATPVLAHGAPATDMTRPPGQPASPNEVTP